MVMMMMMALVVAAAVIVVAVATAAAVAVAAAIVETTSGVLVLEDATVRVIVLQCDQKQVHGEKMIRLFQHDAHAQKAWHHQTIMIL
jgi:hypothetical protein